MNAVADSGAMSPKGLARSAAAAPAPGRVTGELRTGRERRSFRDDRLDLDVDGLQRQSASNRTTRTEKHLLRPYDVLVTARAA